MKIKSSLLMIVSMNEFNHCPAAMLFVSKNFSILDSTVPLENTRSPVSWPCSSVDTVFVSLIYSGF